MKEMRWKEVVAVIVTVVLGVKAACAGEPIRWIDGSWDLEGRPQGKLLSDNPKWFGPRVFTGVTYEWEEAPTFPADIVGNDTARPNQRLIGGETKIVEWDTVGRPGDKPIVAVFDFKRPCSFTEVDFVSERCTNATATVSFSPDGKRWSAPVVKGVSNVITRLRFDDTKDGRYMRLSFQALPIARNTWWKNTKGYTFLDEVVVWGDGEVSERYPENVEPIPIGESLAFTNITRDVVSILPMPTPHLNRKPHGATPVECSIKMARNETESRYFAVVNGGVSPVTIALAAPVFGDGVSSELLVGGVVRISPPKRRLSDEEMVQLHTTDRYGINKGDVENLDVLPFFFPHTVLPLNCMRKYLANPDQVMAFPDAVTLGSHEGCVVMLRITTEECRQGDRTGVLKAGRVNLPIKLSVVDLLLPEQKMWIYAYEPFTWQFPFESVRRIRRDAERYAAVGATTTRYLPEKGTKEFLFFKKVPNASIGYVLDEDVKAKSAIRKIKKGKFADATKEELTSMTEAVSDLYCRARKLGLERERVVAFLMDEPGPENGRSVMQMAERIKQDVPESILHCDPLCFRGGSDFMSNDEILKLLMPEYDKYVDISCPIDYISGREELLKTIWTGKRLVNAQYNHPAGRTGTHMAYDCARKGFNGFAYYCYYHPNGKDPWDIRTWGVLNYDYQAVFPLAEDVALTPLYEFLREGAETCRLLCAVKAAGKTDVYDEVLKRSEKAWDRTYFQYGLMDSSREDILSLRERMLEVFQ